MYDIPAAISTASKASSGLTLLCTPSPSVVLTRLMGGLLDVACSLACRFRAVAGDEAVVHLYLYFYIYI